MENQAMRAMWYDMLERQQRDMREGRWVQSKEHEGQRCTARHTPHRRRSRARSALASLKKSAV